MPEPRCGSWNTDWLGHVEYLHNDSGNSGGLVGGITNGVRFDTTIDTTSRHLTVDTVRAGLGYQFR